MKGFLYKKLVVLILFEIMLLLSFSPIVNSEEFIKNINIQSNEENQIDPECIPLKFGFIHGETMWVKGWACGMLSFTKIVAKGENYSRNKYSGFFGIYFLFVPLDTEITITASKVGHETLTKKVTLTNENRIEYVGFMLYVL